TEVEEDEYDLEEVPNKISRYAGLRRFFAREFDLVEGRRPRIVAKGMKTTVLVLDPSCGPDWRYCDSIRPTNKCWQRDEIEVDNASLEYLG
ncbi:hypothetical protein ACXITY_25445, partial [Vibrio parahaemolyticus]